MSVVVAVYNTGRYIEPCLESLVAQSLPESEYEVILVDDGSDDAVTARRIDTFAAEHRNVTALHIPNSGWPGRPRNVGIGKARGEYVYFLDHDDSLAPEALERMYDMAARNHADVIIGKIAGHGRRVPTTLFRRNYESCTVETAPLMESMTPHKGFRRAFLDQHGIRFPEGRRRLEDHVFVVEAYLRADVVSVLSDYTCYHHIARDDAGNAGFQAIEPVGYYGNLREAVAVAERLTEPGPRRDLVLRRWYEVEMLRRVTGRTFAKMAAKQRRAMYDEVRKLALEHFTSERIWAPLPAKERVASELLRGGRFDDLVRLAELAAQQELAHHVQQWEWADGQLRFAAVVCSRTARGEPALTVVGDRALYAAQVPGVSEEARIATLPARAELELRLRGTQTRHRLPLGVEPLVDRGARAYRLTGSLDPASTAGKPLVGGVWDLFVRLRDPDAGPELVRRVGSEHGRVTAPRTPAALVGEPPLVVIPYVTEKGNLSLDVGERTKKLVDAVGDGNTTARVEPASQGRVAVTTDLSLHLAAATSDIPLRLVGFLPEGVEVWAPVTAQPGGDPSRAVLTARLPAEAAQGRLALGEAPDAPQVSLRTCSADTLTAEPNSA
ncbi:glycosyltransferase family A protein [Pedococcus sp. 5OH_020]|uniref:glycosyltransferase family A protein n=1 Tax=Pedococcus sp. 5OH_020 TaxID=2989814 RepID=UPI0022E9DE81|nr:glycosyltransferase family A protein [Pedococcus sp. 5OH_020]